MHGTRKGPAAPGDPTRGRRQDTRHDSGSTLQTRGESHAVSANIPQLSGSNALENPPPGSKLSNISAESTPKEMDESGQPHRTHSPLHQSLTWSVLLDDTRRVNHGGTNTTCVQSAETHPLNPEVHIGSMQAARETSEAASSHSTAPYLSTAKHPDEIARPRLDGIENKLTSTPTLGPATTKHESNTTASACPNRPAQEVGKGHKQNSDASSAGSVPCDSDEDNMSSPQSEQLHDSLDISKETQGRVDVVTPVRKGEREGRPSGRENLVSCGIPAKVQVKKTENNAKPSTHPHHRPKPGPGHNPGHSRATDPKSRVPDEFDKMREVQSTKLRHLEEEATKLMQGLQNLVRAREREIDCLRTRLSAGNTAWQCAQRQHEDDLRQLEELRDCCNDRRADNEGKQNTIEKLSRRIEEDEKAISAQAQEIKKLEENLRVITGDHSDMERHRDLLRNDLSEKAGQLAEARNHNNDLQKRIKSDLESSSKVLQEMATTIQTDFEQYRRNSIDSLASGTNLQMGFNIKLLRTLAELSKSVKCRDKRLERIDVIENSIRSASSGYAVER